MQLYDRFEFVPGDHLVDAEYNLKGGKTSVQVCAYVPENPYAVNSYEYNEEGRLVSMQGHGFFKTAGEAMQRAIDIDEMLSKQG